MKALFVTSATTDVDSLVRAWDCWQDVKSVRVAFPHMGPPMNDEILVKARKIAPDIIFYIGGAQGDGNPDVKTLRRLRKLAPSINLCCDAGDEPWHPLLRRYRAAGCFDLQVSLDGIRAAPVDLVTITPVDPRPWKRSKVLRSIRCGFSGGASLSITPRTRRTRDAFKVRFQPPITRERVIHYLEANGLVVVGRRMKGRSYSDHVAFVMSCRMIINTSASGSGYANQIKGRVLEVGWAGCALLESEASPISEWMPEGSYFSYRDVGQALELINNLTDEQIAESADLLSRHVRENYHPRQIYGQILERAGVDSPQSLSSAKS